MRILLDYRPALRQRTGVGEFAHRLAEALGGAMAPADALTLFSSSWKDRLPPGRVAGARQVDCRIPVRLLNVAWHSLGWPPIERLAGPCDVAHSLHPLLIPASRAARVVTIHDLYFLDHAHRTGAEIRRDYPRLAERHARRADAVIVPSAYTARQVVERFQVPEDRITVCSPGAPEWAPRPEPAGGGPILFVGTVEPRKNLQGLLGAYARLATARPGVPDLVIAGRVTEPMVSLVGAQQRDLLVEKVRWLGYVDDETRLRLYHQASMLVMPSLDEGFGIPGLEAMTLGVPVVASRRGALEEVLGDAAVFVEPDDPGSIAHGMARVLDDPALRARLRADGLARCRLFDWHRSARLVYAAYGAAIIRRRERA